MSFFASGTHQNYNLLIADNTERNAIEWITDWLNLQIERAARDRVLALPVDTIMQFCSQM